ncbi:hypothetical protein SAY87_020431 [Trapa incisa]|uniref:Uncharacterized protein n=1 Tax=Trapa incisa TaxID=236973 RepID=A0AAN7K9Z0_9MYRT|nr:hypothetical protein SAY87_020431 [Trapa incisa]
MGQQSVRFIGITTVFHQASPIFDASATTSFVFRGTGADIETGFPGYIHERPSVQIHAHWPVNSNSLAFLVDVCFRLLYILFFPFTFYYKAINSIFFSSPSAFHDMLLASNFKPKLELVLLLCKFEMGSWLEARDRGRTWSEEDQANQAPSTVNPIELPLPCPLITRCPQSSNLWNRYDVVPRGK